MAIYWAELSNERDQARRRGLADRLRALAEREAVDPSWQAELRSLDPRLELERWGERWALGWAERPARAVAELVVDGLPAECSIDLGVRAAPLEAALREVQARTGVDLSKARVRVGLGRGHLFELVVTIPRDVAGDEDTLQIASELLVERALGLCVVDEWIGSVEVARSGHSRGLSVLGESRAAETHEIELLPEPYPASTQKVTIDLTHRPEDNIWIKYSVYDIQGLLGTSSNMREGRPLSMVVITERTDEEPPTIEPLAQVELEECAGGEAVVIPFPVDAVEDNCGEVTIAGQAIALNGQPLTPPIPLDETAGALLTNPGDYTVEWIATDQAGNQSEPVLQTVTLNACMGAGSSLQIQNSVTLKNPDGSPMATMVLGNGSTLIGGQSSIGSVTSAASVQIDGGAVVAGDAISAGAIVVHAGAVVQGQVQANQNLQLPAPPGIIGTFPAQCGPAVQYNADAGEHELATRLLRGAPSRLSYPDRAPGRRLRLSSAAGRTGSRRITAGHAAVDVRDDLTFRGRLQLPTGEEGRLALQYRGTNVALVEAPFSGSVLAPQGTLVLGGNHGQVFRGRFYGQNVDVRAGLQVVSEPGLGTFGTLSYQEQRLSHESRSSAEVGGCSAAPGRVPGSWEYLALLSLGGLLLGTRRRRLC